MMNLIEIRAEGERLKKLAKIENVFPVPVEKIAQELGYHVAPFRSDEELDAISGAIDYENKKIFYDEEESIERIQFVIAHEIAHAVLHKGTSIVDYRSVFSGEVDEREGQANAFAAELLMPKTKFIDVFDEVKGDLEKVSRFFCVTLATAEIRARYLRLIHG